MFGGFAEPIEDGWRGVITTSSGGGGSDCLLGYSEQTAVLRGSALVIELERHSEDVPGLSETECDPSEAERRNITMPCDEHELVDATLL